MLTDVVPRDLGTAGCPIELHGGMVDTQSARQDSPTDYDARPDRSARS